MADNTVLNAGDGLGDTIATDEVGAAKHQLVKIEYGTDGNATSVSDSNPLPIDDAGGSLTVDGTVTANLAAGTNNIGDVDVLTEPATAADGAAGLPATTKVVAGYDGTNVQALTTNSAGNLQVGLSAAIPAGTNNIGDVDILSIAAGDNNIGNVDVVTLPALAAGTNAIGKLAANSGVDIGDVDVTSLPALATGTNTVGNVGLAPRTSGGLTLHRTISAASTNATSVKGSAGQLCWMYLHNVNAAVRYLKLYNKASAPTVGSDTPVLTIPIPGNTAGAGATSPITLGLAFGTGIAFALTTGVADADTGAVAANEIVVNLGYA